jgi:hypothetical protein
MSDNSPSSSSASSDSGSSSSPKPKSIVAVQPETAKDLESLGKS